MTATFKTFRHDTFEPVSYQQAERLIRQHTRQPQQQQALLTVLQSPQDAYYRVYYREGDTNVGLRLRAWRPSGEVLLPWELRQSIAKGRNRIPALPVIEQQEMNAAELTAQFEAALVYATRLHPIQNRRNHIAHLLSVAALVLEAGGNEDEAIAALLHDAVEIRVGYLAIKFANALGTGSGNCRWLHRI